MLRTERLRPRPWTSADADLATESARAGIGGFDAGLPEVSPTVGPGNAASMAVCRRLGMAPLGRIRRWYDVEPGAFRLMAPNVIA